MAGALLEFIFNAEPSAEEINYQAVKSGKKAAPGPKRHITARERFAGQSLVGSWIAAAVIIATRRKLRRQPPLDAGELNSESRCPDHREGHLSPVLDRGGHLPPPWQGGG